MKMKVILGVVLGLAVVAVIAIVTSVMLSGSENSKEDTGNPSQSSPIQSNWRGKSKRRWNASFYLQVALEIGALVHLFNTSARTKRILNSPRCVLRDTMVPVDTCCLHFCLRFYLSNICNWSLSSQSERMSSEEPAEKDAELTVKNFLGAFFLLLGKKLFMSVRLSPRNKDCGCVQNALNMGLSHSRGTDASDW